MSGDSHKNGNTVTFRTALKAIGKNSENMNSRMLIARQWWGMPLIPALGKKRQANF